MLNFLPVILNFLSVILNEVKNLVLWSFWSALRTRSFGHCPQDDSEEILRFLCVIRTFSLLC
jgi:hypothetical protein